MWASIGANNTIRFVCWIMPGQPCAECLIPHTGEGFLQLTGWLSEHTGAAAPETIGVVLETSSGPVVECGQTNGYTVYAMNPEQADRFRDRFSPAGAKDDRLDALVLATALYLEPQTLQRLERPENSSIELRDRCRKRQNLLQLQVRFILQVQQVFWRYYPQFATLFGSDLALPFVAVLWHRMPNPRQAQRTRKSTVAAILKKHHIRPFDAREVLARTITYRALTGACSNCGGSSRMPDLTMATTDTGRTPVTGTGTATHWNTREPKKGLRYPKRTMP